MSAFLQELRYALRQLRRSPVFVLVAIITLAIGIGANTAVFSVLQAVVLAPLPYPQADQLMNVWLYNRTLKYPTEASYPDFLDWQRSARSFQTMAAFAPQDYDLTAPGTAEHLSGLQVSAGFFRTLGAKLGFGRDFSQEEDSHAGAPVVIISDRLWKSRFAGSPDVLGKSVMLTGVAYRIIGVLPPQFRFEEQPADVYTAIGQRSQLLNGDRTIHNTGCIARLRDGVSQSQAQAELGAIQDNIDRLYPAADRGSGVMIDPFKQEVIGDVRATILILTGAVGIVLLIACANVANLLLVRSTARVREFAIRTALGASRARMMRQLITEAMLLSLAGAALGLLIARWGVKFALAVFGQNLPRSESVGLNMSVLLFTVLVAVGVGILFGLLPAFRSSEVDVAGALKDRDRGSSSSHHRTQSFLVGAQMALTIVLLAGGGLLFRSIQRLWRVNPGFEPQHVLTFKVGLSFSAITSPEDTRIAYQQLMQRIREIPGIEAADITALLPFSQQDNSGPFWFGALKPASMAEAPRAIYYFTGPDYQKTMQIPLLRGRYFTMQDNLRSEPVVVVDSLFARKYFPNQDPVGQTVTVAHWHTARIIGVVGEVKHWGLGNPTAWTHPAIYGCFYQLDDEWIPGFRDSVSVAVRTPIDAATIMPSIKAAIYGLAHDEPVYAVRTMQQYISESLTAQRSPMLLLAAFAGTALLLATVGIYGVISYWTGQRVREIGIRVALGAQKRDILRLVVGHGVRITIAATVIGGAAALLLTRMLSSFSNLLYGVTAGDPVTLLSVSGLLSGIATLACYIPARRAASIDPMQALRIE